jgi:hypothetical protein
VRVLRVALILSLLALAPLWRSVLLGEVPYEDDLTTFSNPQHAMLYRAAQVGVLPRWNPYVFTGMPLVADLQFGAFYPLGVMYYLLPPPYANPVFIHLHLVIGGLGAFLLLRRKLLPAARPSVRPGASGTAGGTREKEAERAALFGAITFAFGGFLIAHHIHCGPLAGAALMPWVLLALDGWAAEGRLRCAMAAGVVMALQVLSGHLQMVFYAGLFGGLYVAAVAWDAGPPGRRVPRVAGRVAGVLLSAAVACALSAVQLLPALQLAVLGTRSQSAVWQHTASFSLDPGAWPLLLVPDLLGRGQGATFDGPHNYWEMTTYVGILPLLLALFALGRRAPRPARWLAGMGTLIAIGRWGGLHWVLYSVMPGYRLFRSPSRAWLVVALALAWLAALAYHRLCERLDEGRAAPDRSWLPYALLGLGVAAALAAPLAMPMVPTDAGERLRRLWAVWRFAALAATSSLLLVAALRRRVSRRRFEQAAFALVLVDLGLQWTPYVATRPARELVRPPALVESIKATVGSGRLFAFGERTPAVPRHQTEWQNAGQIWGFRQLRGYNPMVPASVVHTLTRETPQPQWAAAYNPYFASAPSRLLGYGVAAVLVPIDYAGPLPEGAERVADDGRFVLHRVPASPRARVVDGAGHDAGSATFLSDGEDQVSLRACANVSARLELYDTDYPGWTAEVDGRLAPIARVEAFRAVALAPGCHDVRFRYRERWLALGTWISVVSALGLAAVFSVRA